MAKILTIADAATLEVVQELLEREGHQIEVAPDARDGFDLAAESQSPVGGGLGGSSVD